MKSKRNIAILLVILVLVIIGLLAFFDASFRSHVQGMFMHGHDQNGMATTTQRYMGGRGMTGGFVRGSIETLNDNGFTLTLQDGTTQDVTVSATSTIYSFATASSTPMKITSDALSVGEPILVIGTPVASTSIDASIVVAGVTPSRTELQSILPQMHMRNASSTNSHP